MTAKILIIDIETAPNMAYVWGAWKQNIGQNQWKAKGYVLSYAAKWLGEQEVHYEDLRDGDEKHLIKSVYKLLDEADMVVAHNGIKFDLPVILGRGVVHGFKPPSPYFTVDTLATARREFRFVSNTLANLCEELGLTKKGKHKKFPGFELWIEVMKNNNEAWEEMKEYNVQDIVSLEELYVRLRPYMKNHPNVVRDQEGDKVKCPKCGSENIQWRGYYYTRAGMCYRRFQCKDCGGWGRVRFSDKDKSVSTGRNAT